ncbi:MAG: DUF4124 domain-containing protein [Thiotrichaceae bacterium]|nr:DUF4124 domain-containing protein [Thiotrichaceae bacterium]
MRITTLTISLTITISSFANIYTWTDENGKTIYGDNPPEHNIQEVIPQELTIIPAYTDPNETNQSNILQDTEKRTEYTTFKITTPAHDKTIQVNTGTIDIAMELSPTLSDKDRIFIYLDGKKVIKDSQSLSASLQSLDRGTHTLFAVVRTEEGDVLINSNTVKFHLLRSSRIHKRSFH